MATPQIGPTPAEIYERFFVPGMFRPLALELLQRADIREGESLLDLACGTGIVARLAAPRVGREGRVVALDLREVMIAAGEAIPAPPGANINWHVGDATSLDFPAEEFTVVVCQQGLQFFADRNAALREIRRVLKPGGRLVAATWASLDQQTLFAEMARSEIEHLAAFGIGSSDIELPFSFGDRHALASSFAAAGFKRVRTEEVSIRTDFEAEGFVANVEYAYSAVVPDFVGSPDAFQRFVDGVERDASRSLASFTANGRVQFTMRSNVAIGFV